MRRRRRQNLEAPTFASEAELCASFTKFVQNRGWTVHPETSDFDMLLVWGKDIGHPQRQGDVVGVQAKLRPSLELLEQARPRWHRVSGPDFHVVIAPRVSTPFLGVAAALGLCVSTPNYYGHWNLPLASRHYYPKRLWYPETPVDMAAGVPSPRSVTKWKVTAVQLCLYGLRRGYVTSADFNTFGLSMGRWVDQGWIEDTGHKEGKLKKYKITDKAPHASYPEVTASLQKDAGRARDL